MTKTMGRKRRFTSFVISGNRNGLIGIGKARSSDSKFAVKKAQRKSVFKLIYVNLEEKHTSKILHKTLLPFYKANLKQIVNL